MENLGKKVIYQIYPKSFKDTSSTGFGDLKGITSKVDYLKDLGIDMVWMSPFFMSPQNDNGYDISDYYTVDPMFGTNEDLYELIDVFKENGIDVMLDMVLNHTSTEHEWFQKALAGDPKYMDYYYITDGKGGNLPNNWESVFKGDAWHKFGDTDKYYLALFEKTQADLNWHSEDLRKELFDMVNFWLEKGVKGFRFDVLNMIGKSPDYTDWTDWSHDKYQHTFYTDTPIVHDFIKELSRESYGKYGDIITVGEMGNVDVNNALKYTDKGDELSMIFAFDHLDDGEMKGKWTETRYNLDVTRRNLFMWQEKMQEGNGWLGLFWGNHDNPRSLSRFGDPDEYRYESATMLAQSLHLLRGTPYVYQGDEFAMINPTFNDISEYNDIESINAYNEMIENGLDRGLVLRMLNNKSRDNSRTPMQWDSENEYASFSDVSPWLKVAESYKEINAKKDRESDKSVFEYYKKLIELRHENDVISDGLFYPLLEDHEYILAYKRILDDKEIVNINNFSKETVNLNLKDLVDNLDDYKILISNYDDSEIKDEITLRAYESIAIEN